MSFHPLKSPNGWGKTMASNFLQHLSNSMLYDTEELVIKNSDALINSLRSYLSAAEYNMALACFDLAIEKKQGKFRKDRQTPAIIHEVSQALYTISLIEDGVYLNDPESVIALNFIHDLGEDFGLKPQELKQYLYNKGLADINTIEQLAVDFDLITKKYKNEIPKFKYEFNYYSEMQESLNVSIAKLVDRIHNVATQIGVQSEQRCSEYIRNTELIINDYTKYASKKFPKQKEAYTNCEKMLKVLCQINRYYLAREEMGKPLPNHSTLQQEMPDKGFKVPAGLNPIMLVGTRIIKQPGWSKEQIIESKVNLGDVLKKLGQQLNIF